MSHFAKAARGMAAGAAILETLCKRGPRRGRGGGQSLKHSAKAARGDAVETAILETLCKTVSARSLPELQRCCLLRLRRPHRRRARRFPWALQGRSEKCSVFQWLSEGRSNKCDGVQLIWCHSSKRFPMALESRSEKCSVFHFSNGFGVAAFSGCHGFCRRGLKNVTCFDAPGGEVQTIRRFPMVSASQHPTSQSHWKTLHFSDLASRANGIRWRL